jgi:hypothetical protein
MKPISVLLMLPLAAACASGAPQWEKAGVSPSATNEAMQECRMASRMAPEPALGTPTPRTTMGTPGIDRIEERDGREAAQFRQCMTAKGYAAKR